MKSSRILMGSAVLVLLLHGVLVVWLEAQVPRALASNLAQIVAAGLAVTACILAGRRSGFFEKNVWYLTASAFFLWILAQIDWTYADYVQYAQAYHPTDFIFFFAFTPLAMALLLEPREDHHRLDWQRTMDLIQIGLVVFAAYLYFFYLPAKIEDPEAAFVRRVTVLFNTRNGVLLGCAALRAAFSSVPGARAVFRRLTAILIIYTAATPLANFARLQRHLLSGHLVDVAWSLPFVAATIIVATWQPGTYTSRERRRFYHARRFVGDYLVPTAVPLAVLLMSISIAQQHRNLAALLFSASFIAYGLRFAITQYREQQASEGLREAEERFRLLFAANPHAMWVVDMDTLRFIEVNAAACTRYGYAREQFLAMRVTDIRPVEEVPRLLDALTNHGSVREMGVFRHRLKNGEVIHVEISAEPLQMDGHNAMLVLAQDVSEKQKLEEQLRQSQKMEAVGTLAGGIAHDFNNLLTVIKGYSCLLADHVAGDEQLAREAHEIEHAADKAAALTQQLLAFSRRQVLQPRILSLNEVVASTDRMLRRLIGEHIELITTLTADAGTVKVDPTQLEQVIVNLVVNARDAMPNGGKLVLATRNVEVDDDYARARLGFRPGSYVMLEVADTGDGMDAETQRHIFEPFFTTKEVGRGTGLGLSTVYGIVKQSGGYITVESAPGQGATFRIYMPRVQPPAALLEPGKEPPPRGAGSETLLLVEDEELVRQLSRRILESNGYKVLEAENAEVAIKLFEERASDVRMVVTDVVMPGMSGPEMVQRLRRLVPDVRVLFISGYADKIAREGSLEVGAAFLEKPFSPASLTRAVRDVLEGKRADTWSAADAP